MGWRRTETREVQRRVHEIGGEALIPLKMAAEGMGRQQERWYTGHEGGWQPEAAEQPKKQRERASERTPAGWDVGLGADTEPSATPHSSPGLLTANMMKRLERERRQSTSPTCKGESDAPLSSLQSAFSQGPSLLLRHAGTASRRAWHQG